MPDTLRFCIVTKGKIPFKRSEHTLSTKRMLDKDNKNYKGSFDEYLDEQGLVREEMEKQLLVGHWFKHKDKEYMVENRTIAFMADKK